MPQVRYRTAIRHMKAGNWESRQCVLPGSVVQFHNIITGRNFVRRVAP